MVVWRKLTCTDGRSRRLRDKGAVSIEKMGALAWECRAYRVVGLAVGKLVLVS